MARKARPTRPALFPMPVDGLFSHPNYVALPAAGRGMLLSLCEHYWRSACKPLPKDDDQLFAMARAHRPTWRHWRPTILALFDDIRPELERYHHARTTNATTINFAARNGGHAKQAKARLAALQDSTPAPVTPITLPRHDPTQHTPPRRPQAPQRSQARLQDR
jgi:uncharacterized protein YdaU (DUF1376 family)